MKLRIPVAKEIVYNLWVCMKTLDDINRSYSKDKRLEDLLDGLVDAGFNDIEIKLILADLRTLS